MREGKNAALRYQVLDRCFSDFKRMYTFDDLLEAVNEHLCYMNGDDAKINVRQLRDDISYIRKYVPSEEKGVYLDAVPFDGKKCYYRYRDAEGNDVKFSIYNNELSADELKGLQTTIQMLGRYSTLPSNGWLQEVISKLELRFGTLPKSENLVAFDNNEQLQGLERLSDIIGHTINHQTLEIDYVSAKGNKLHYTLSPYYVKQYNRRWFLFGRDNMVEPAPKMIVNLALDRITGLKPSDKAFIKNTDIDFDKYFDDVVGVSVPVKERLKLSTVILKFSPERLHYVLSKPIHKTQQLLSEEEGTVSLRVYITKELEQQIFSFGPDVEVLAPAKFRAAFKEKIELCLTKYLSVQ